jgi:hypothetical protein
MSIVVTRKLVKQGGVHSRLECLPNRVSDLDQAHVRLGGGGSPEYVAEEENHEPKRLTKVLVHRAVESNVVADKYRCF